MSVDVSSAAPSGFERNALAAPVPSAPKTDLVAFRESEEGKALVAWAHQSYRAAKSARESEERQWKKNLAMYNGKQYLEVVKAGQYAGMLMERPRNPNTDRKTINRTEPLVRTEISRLVSQKPSANVLPASSDDEDMFAAMAGEQIWQSHSDRRHFSEVITEACFWLSITGNGFIKTYWDESAVDTDADMQGDIIYENITPFNLLVSDLRETRIENQPWVCNYYTKPVAWLEMFYKEELAGIKLNASANAANEVLEETYLNLPSGNKATPDSCVVYEWWVKPGATRFMPNGGYLVVVDTTLVAYLPEPVYAHGEYPFTHIGHLISGKFYRRSVLNSTNPLNEDYNSWRTQLSQARKRMGHPQILSQKGAISASRWTNETGLVIEYRPGFQKPEPFPLASMPPYIMEEGQNILTDIEDISGQHQVSKGNVPPGVTAATAISYLQEKDDSYLTPTYQSLEAGCQKIAKQTLSLVVQFWDVPRLVKVAGEDNQFDTLLLTGADIKNGCDIRVEAGSSLPTSKAAKQAFVMDLMNMGAVPMDKGLEILEIGGASKLIDQLKSDKRQAQRENVQMKSLTSDILMAYAQDWEQRQQMNDPSTVDAATGEPLVRPPAVTVNTWDNHAVHIDTHNLYRRSQAFQFLSDEVKQEFESHVNMHKQMQRQEQLQAMIAGIPTDGSVPGVSGIIDPGTGQPVAEVSQGGGEGVPPQPPEITGPEGGEQIGAGSE